MQFSPTSCHFISFRSKYSPRHPVLKYLQFFPSCQRPSSTPIQNYGKNNSFAYCNFYFFRQQTRTKMSSQLDGSKHCPNFNLLLISSWITFWFVIIIPKYLNLASFSKDLLTISSVPWKNLIWITRGFKSSHFEWKKDTEHTTQYAEPCQCFPEVT
jgi:hypothetical protein